MSQQLWFLAAGVLGFLFHSLCKLKSLSDDAAAANIPFSWKKDYLQKDIFGILLALLAPLVWLLVFGEIAAQYPRLEKFALCSFFVMGTMGSWIIQLVLGRAKKQIRKVVDEKTNIADAKTGNE